MKQPYGLLSYGEHPESQTQQHVVHPVRPTASTVQRACLHS
jgi:hypothetical protein